MIYADLFGLYPLPCQNIDYFISVLGVKIGVNVYCLSRLGADDACAFLEAVSPELAMAIGRLPIPQKVYDRYENLGIEFLDDRKFGSGEVTGAADGTLEYTTSRDGLEGDNTTPDTGDEDIVPDEDED